MIRVMGSFADGPENFNPTGPAEDQTQKLISSTESTNKENSLTPWTHLSKIKSKTNHTKMCLMNIRAALNSHK